MLWCAITAVLTAAYVTRIEEAKRYKAEKQWGLELRSARLTITSQYEAINELMGKL